MHHNQTMQLKLSFTYQWPATCMHSLPDSPLPSLPPITIIIQVEVINITYNHWLIFLTTFQFNLHEAPLHAHCQPMQAFSNILAFVHTI